jgi:CDP-diacylglycerol--serine O-phosphatidyltransferase
MRREPPFRAERHIRRGRARQRILRSTAVLPSLFTIFNGLSGFAAIHFATRQGLGQARLEDLRTSSLMIFLAMVFDMLDGRVARMTRRTSDFGGQLDSLADVISFGAAPAMLTAQTVIMAMRGQVERLSFLPDTLMLERIVWCVAGVYLSCAALRLARFNVENEPDESAHMHFSGLPSPGAAAAVASLVVLFVWLTSFDEGWRSSDWALGTVSIALPVLTLMTGLLMVSRFRYSHVVNQYVRGRRPFSYIVKLVVIALAAMVQPMVTLAVVMVGYALSGPASWLWRRRQRGRPAPAGADELTFKNQEHSQ